MGSRDRAGGWAPRAEPVGGLAAARHGNARVPGMRRPGPALSRGDVTARSDFLRLLPARGCRTRLPVPRATHKADARRSARARARFPVVRQAATAAFRAGPTD